MTDEYTPKVCTNASAGIALAGFCSYLVFWSLNFIQAASLYERVREAHPYGGIRMLDDNIKKPEETRSGNPTPKQLKYVKKLASQTGEDLGDYDISTFDGVSRTIDLLQKKIPPTDKQIAFAKKLSEEHKFEIPQEAMESKAAMSKWLEKVTGNEGR
jgi:hypothetical protein